MLNSIFCFNIKISDFCRCNYKYFCSFDDCSCKSNLTVINDIPCNGFVNLDNNLL